MLPVIDIFAGPGGLGEGFSQAGFDVALSCEMDPIACQTLILRKFFHLFPKSKAPDEYYQFISNKITIDELKEKFLKKWKKAEKKVLNIELGAPDTSEIVHGRINEVTSGDRDFILVGGPPCQAYSIAGRSRRLGLGTKSDETNKENAAKLRFLLAEEFYKDPRHKLYLEYLKILAIHQPAVFVMENVKGLTSARTGLIDKPGSVFSNIVSGLKDPFSLLKKHKNINMLSMNSKVHYKLYSVINNKEGDLLFNLNDQVSSPKECVIKAEEFGVPQNRHRIIIIGIRGDLACSFKPLQPSKDRVTVSDTILHMPKVRSGLSKQEDSTSEWLLAINNNVKKYLMDQVSPELKINEKINSMSMSNVVIDRGSKVVKTVLKPFKSELNLYLEDKNMNFVIQHETRGHLVSDLIRYFFCSAFGETYDRSPKMSEWQGDLDYLKPNHKNVGVNKNKLGTDTHNDRFRVQVWNKPSSTIVSHISKDGNYFIHPDPTQCRSLTVREAARLQTFPDNYYFFGNRTQQYHQVGNAVPSFLSKKIATQIKELLKDA